MKNSISDTEIHEIVQRVVQKTMDYPITSPTSSSNPSSQKTVALGTDHGGVDLKEILKKHLTEKVHCH